MSAAAGNVDADEEEAVCRRRCQKLACAIQTCLAANGYQEARCAAVISRWESCCARARRDVRSSGAVGASGAADGKMAESMGVER